MIRTAIGLATLALCSPVSAKVLVLTIDGVVTSGYDGAGRFGPAGRDLTGSTFRATFAVNTSFGARSTYRTSLTTHDEILGDWYAPQEAPLRFEDFDIAGVSYTLKKPDYLNNAVQRVTSDFGPTKLFGYNSSNFSYGSIFEVFDIVFDIRAYLRNKPQSEVYETLDDDLSYALFPLDYSKITFASSNYDRDTGVFQITDLVGMATGFNYEVAPPSTPEPDTWTMMITGVAFVGVAIRQSRSKPRWTSRAC